MTNRTDDFNRADNASALGTPSDSGGGWTVGAGTYGINGNKAYESAGSSLTACWLEASISDCDVQATLSTVSAALGVVSRAADNNNYLFGGSNSGTGLSMFKRVAGSFTSL